MHHSYIPSELPPPPWVEPDDGLVYDSYADNQNPFKQQNAPLSRREEISMLRQEEELRQRFPHDAAVRNAPERLARRPMMSTPRPFAAPPRPFAAAPRPFAGPPPPPVFHDHEAWDESVESMSSYSSHDIPSHPAAHGLETRGESTEGLERGFSGGDKGRSHHSRRDGSFSHAFDTILRFEVRREESDGQTTPNELSPGRADQPWLISQSQYNGDALRTGADSAKVTKALRSGPTNHCLFRWLHVNQSMMDFREFSHKISQIPLAEPEKQQLNDFVSDVRLKTLRTLLTSVQGDREVFHLEPGVIRRGAFTWICMPYFSFEKYSGLEAATETPFLCPIQTLMQAYLSSSSKKMDLKQAMHKDTPTAKNCVLHVSQLWCIIVGQCK